MEGGSTGLRIPEKCGGFTHSIFFFFLGRFDSCRLLEIVEELLLAKSSFFGNDLELAIPT